MSKIQALMNYLNIDSDENIDNFYGNCYEYNENEYEIMTEYEVIDYGEILISDEIEILLDESVPSYLHEYFNKEKYIQDNIDNAFSYVDFGKGYHEVEDDDGNTYFIFPI